MSAIISRIHYVMRGKTFDKRGQMTVELAVVFPVVIVIAAITVNACTFFSECAQFDRISRNAVRIVAASPAYEQTAGDSADKVREIIESQMGSVVGECQVTAEQSGAYLKFTMSMSYSPTLFGLGMRQSIFGVSLPSLMHTSTLSVDPYKPGMLF